MHGLCHLDLRLVGYEHETTCARQPIRTVGHHDAATLLTADLIHHKIELTSGRTVRKPVEPRPLRRRRSTNRDISRSVMHGGLHHDPAGKTEGGGPGDPYGRARLQGDPDRQPVRQPSHRNHPEVDVRRPSLPEFPCHRRCDLNDPVRVGQSRTHGGFDLFALRSGSPPVVNQRSANGIACCPTFSTERKSLLQPASHRHQDSEKREGGHHRSEHEREDEAGNEGNGRRGPSERHPPRR